jgi:hypothetical protein
MHTDLVHAITQFADRNRIIKILCINRVDGESEYVAAVPSFFDLG